MRTFQTIYKNASNHYAAFIAAPQNMPEATMSLRCFIEEANQDMQLAPEKLEHLKLCFAWNAQQFILNKAQGSESRTFRQFLSGVYKSINNCNP